MCPCAMGEGGGCCVGQAAPGDTPSWHLQGLHSMSWESSSLRLLAHLPSLPGPKLWPSLVLRDVDPETDSEE